MTAPGDLDAVGREAVPLAPPLIGPPSGVVREVEVDGCLTLYRRDLDRVLVLNATAGDVWRLCDGTLGESDMIELLARAYGVDPDAIADDVRLAIERFTVEGFVDLRLP